MCEENTREVEGEGSTYSAEGDSAESLAPTLTLRELGGFGVRISSALLGGFFSNGNQSFADIFAPMQKQLRVAMPDTSNLISAACLSMDEGVRGKMASLMPSIPLFAFPIPDLSGIEVFRQSSAIKAMCKQIMDYQSTVFTELRDSLINIFPQDFFSGFNRSFLPPNLRSYADEIRVSQVLDFLEDEGIPLYLVPRGRTAMRLLRAPDRSARHKILGDCHKSITDDCYAVLRQVDCAALEEAVKFALEGIAAMRDGHFSSAQAMFTVTLDTLILRYFSNKQVRRSLTVCKKDDPVPEAIREMDLHEGMVWLPIWNAHAQFWPEKGDKVPRYYSRHASVHGVSSRQFNKRNCIQVLMLLTSLIGYVGQVVHEDE